MSLSSFPRDYTDGDTLSVVETVPGYTAGTGVSVVYRLSGPEQFTITATGSGTTWTSAIPTGKKPGIYAWQKVGTAAGVVTTLDSGSTRIGANLAATVPTSSAATMLAAAEAAFTSLLADSTESANFNGQSFTYSKRGDLLAVINQLKATVQAEQDALKIQQGLGTGRRISTRFDQYGSRR